MVGVSSCNREQGSASLRQIKTLACREGVLHKGCRHGAMVTLHSALVQTKGAKWKYGILNPLHEYPFRKDHTVGPFAGDLSKKLEVGEQFSVYFIPDHESLARDNYDRVGFNDTFGKYHWASKRDVIETRKHIREACDKVGKSYK